MTWHHVMYSNDAEKWNVGKKCDTLLDLCVSSLRRGHANLLCIVPILTDDLRRGSSSRRNSRSPGFCENTQQPNTKNTMFVFPPRTHPAIMLEGARKTHINSGTRKATTAAKPDPPTKRSMSLAVSESLGRLHASKCNCTCLASAGRRRSKADHFGLSGLRPRAETARLITLRYRTFPSGPRKQG